MSFDLKLSLGGLVLGSNGDFVQVEKENKLIQDILKIILTPLGGNKFYPWYGSAVGGTIGSVLDINFSNTLANSQMSSSLNTLKAIQSQQSKLQNISPEEQLAAVRQILMNQNSVDPRYINVTVKVVNKAFQQVEASAPIPI